jgi:dihydrofolate synthase/folylpolyglutamate synthase
MPIENYQQALSFWYRRVNFELSSPQPADLRLERMRVLLQFLGNPHRRLRVIHIAGSKGKGSTAAMLASILRQAGYRTGLFTSPHLSQVEERIQVDGQPIPHHELTPLLRHVEDTLRSAKQLIDPTFFEIATALGFLHFVHRRVDVAIVEVGLGGRFDSTNVCSPVISVITSISFDHMQQLGNTLSSIANEKAGIIKPGRPVISGATAPEARGVIESICRERGAPLVQLGRDVNYRYEPGKVRNDGDTAAHFQMLAASATNRDSPLYELKLLGEHQAANAAVSLACVDGLRKLGWHIPDAAVAAGLVDVQWPARMEVLGRRPLIVLDCAHNVASAQALADTLLSSFPETSRRLIFACSTDKDVDGILRVLAPHFQHIYLTRFKSPRAAEPAQLAALLPSASSWTSHHAAADALRAAQAHSGLDDLICITGSVFLAGELRPVLVSGPCRDSAPRLC